MIPLAAFAASSNSLAVLSMNGFVTSALIPRQYSSLALSPIVEWASLASVSSRVLISDQSSAAAFILSSGARYTSLYDNTASPLSI